MQQQTPTHTTPHNSEATHTHHSCFQQTVLQRHSLPRAKHYFQFALCERLDKQGTCQAHALWPLSRCVAVAVAAALRGGGGGDCGGCMGLLWFVLVCCGGVRWLCVCCVLCVRVDGVRVCVLVVLVFMGRVCLCGCPSFDGRLHSASLLDFSSDLTRTRSQYPSIVFFQELCALSAWILSGKDGLGRR